MKFFTIASLFGLAAGQFTTNGIRTCSVDADCRIYEAADANDLLSTCTTAGQCVCPSTGFSTYTEGLGGVIYHQCFSNTDPARSTTTVDTYMTMIWEEGNCASISLFETQFQAEVDFQLSSILAPNTPTATINHYCGVNNYGVLTLIQMTLRTTDLYNPVILNMVNNLQARFLTQDAAGVSPELSNLKFDSSLAYPVTFAAFHTAAGSVALCPHDEAVMATFGSKTATSEPCRAISCSSGYNLENGYCVSLAGPPLSDSDDGLGSGAIAGIAVGCSLAVLIVVGIIVYCCCCKKEEADNAPDEESASSSD